MFRSQPKVIVQINGGLGNQLFQYAMGRRLALANNVPLVVDHLSGFPRDFYRRSYSLSRFNVQCGYVPASATYASFRGRIRRRVHRWLNAHRPLEKQTYVQEAPLGGLDPQLLDLKIDRSVYFEGYWQHEDYFRDIAPQLRQELTMNVEHSPENRAVAQRIGATNAVCLHVRRLHGVPNQPDAKPLQGREDLDIGTGYYERAIALLAERVSNPHFFVFSDYPDWARENIRSNHPMEFVVHNNADHDYEDFWLMTLCRHFVVANSTFSWWAAWLAAHPEKIVIASAAHVGKMPKSIPSAWQAL